MMPKRSYDFDKFALDSMLENDTNTDKNIDNEELHIKKVQSFKSFGVFNTSLSSDPNQIKQTDPNFQIDSFPIEESLSDIDLNLKAQSSSKTLNNDLTKTNSSNTEICSKL